MAHRLGLALPLAGMAIQVGMASADELPELGGEQPSLADELASGFYSRINLMAYTLFQETEESTLNPDNAAEIPRYQWVLNPRADLNLSFRNWEFALKPRAEAIWEKWEDGPRDGDDQDSSELFLTEGWVRYRPFDELTLSYGRENLQWGPSVILSLSNPFTRDNGRNNPRVEVPGLDYYRAIWIPNETWTLSTIYNYGPGRSDDVESYMSGQPTLGGGRAAKDEFEKIYAVKLDYTGSSGYASIIHSYRESDQHQTGFFAGWNASDALLLYTEGNIKHEGKTGYQFGASYTLEIGPTVNIEYLRDNNGCDDGPMIGCYLEGKINTRSVLYRQNYAMIQVTDNSSIPDLEYNVRYLRNLDDESQRFTGILEYDVTDHVQAYFTGNIFTGGDDDEFGTLLRYSVFTGISYTF
ncbi:hypothetical protein [Azorhizophilus paspali]|uniref:Outer membrane beta-barrel protein n=1 Tax=Azorhizophilus paspali TaxID=69963 RepID=A0ABV6SMP5_AZOPA